jgi:hypothetical protein
VAIGGTSPVVLTSSASSAAVLIGIIQTPGVSHLFGSTPLGPVGWAIAGTATTAATAVTTLLPLVLSRVTLPGWRQLPFTPTSLSRRLSLSWSPPPVRSLATVATCRLLAASLAYLLQLLAIRLLWHLLPAQ